MEALIPPPPLSEHHHPASRLAFFRFALSYRDVEDMLAERGIDVSYETVRRWALNFGTIIARKLSEDGRGRTGGGISTKCSPPSMADICTSGVQWTAKESFLIFSFNPVETAKRRSS